MHFRESDRPSSSSNSLWFRDEEQDLEPLLRANTATGVVRSEVQREGNELRAACATAQIPSHEEQEQDAWQVLRAADRMRRRSVGQRSTEH
jgi:hypothetical protein